MSFQERFKASPLRQKWRPELSKKNSTSKRRRNRRNKTNSTNEDEDMMLDFDQLQDIPEGTTVLQRAIMYQMEQKLPKLGNDKQKKKKRKQKKKKLSANHGGNDKKITASKMDVFNNNNSTKSTKVLPEGSLPGTQSIEHNNDYDDDFEDEVDYLDDSQFMMESTSRLGSPPRSIMSMLPEAPNLRTIKMNSMKKKKKLTKNKKNKTEPVSTDTFLDQMDEFVEINPKYGSPFAPEKVNKYTAKVDRVTLFSFDSDRAALDEFTSLNRKSLLIFGGFGLGREKPGHGRSGWRSIWETNAMYTGAKAIPRESIERTEGCNYFHGDLYSMSLTRRPKWVRMKSSIAKHERLDAHTVIGDDSQLPRSSHSTVLVRGSYIYVFGGKQRGNVAGGDPSPLNDVRWIDLRTRPRVWRVGNVTGAIPSRRWGHRACMIGENMYVIGGLAGGTPFTRWNPYLDVSHNSSVPRRRNLSSKSSPPKRKDHHSMLFGEDDSPKATNAAPQLFACLNTSSMEWSVPTVVSHDMPRAPKVGHIKQALQAKIPYSMYGHSMTKVNGWNNNGGDNEVDVYLFGGWEWYSDNEFGENLSGPILSDRLTLMRVKDDQTTTVASWTEIKPKSMHRSPGPRSNHTAISHTVGLFIFGGRRLKNGETTPGAPGGNDNNKNSLGRKKKKKKGNNNPHQKMLIVDLEYLNDLCLLIKEENQEDEETKSWVWIPVDVRGKLPRPRESATMTNVYNKSILMFGGYSGEPGTLPPANEPIANRLPGAEPHPWLNDFFVLRIEGGGRETIATWTQVLAPGAPSPRSGVQCMIVDMARADPKKCVITGDGLSQSYVGERTSFDIRAYDDTGERRWCGRDVFQVVLEGPWPESELMVDDDGITRVDIDKQKKRDEPIKVNAILAFVVDNHDGTYKCTYAPLLAGFYSIEVRCNGDEIEGSPYSMWAKAGAPVASRSKMRNANGLEIEQNQTIKVRAGEEFYVDVDISDKFGNPRHEDEDADRLQVRCINFTSSPDSTGKDILFWESVNMKTTIQIQEKFNEMWRKRMFEYAVNFTKNLYFEKDAVDDIFLNIHGLSSQRVSGMTTYKEGLSSTAAIKKFLASADEENGFNDELLDEKKETNTSIVSVYQGGKVINEQYTVAKVYAKIEVSTIKFAKDGVEISNCPRFDFLYHILCTDTQETFAMECKQEAMINIVSDIWNKENAKSRTPLRQNVITPSATYGVFLNAANRTIYKGRLNVPFRKGPCLVAVLLNGQHIAGSPVKLMSNPGFACAELSYAEKLFKENTFMVGQRKPIKIVGMDSSRLNCIHQENCFEIEIYRKYEDGNVNKNEYAPIKCEIAYQGSGVYVSKAMVKSTGNWEAKIYFKSKKTYKSDSERTEIQGSPIAFTTIPASICSSKCIVTKINLSALWQNDLSRLTASVWKQIKQYRMPMAEDYVLRMANEKAATVIEAGTEFVFNILARDMYGNITEGPEKFSIKLISYDKRTIVNGFVTQVPANPSLYVGRFTAQRATFYNVHVTQGHDHILGSPISVLVTPSYSSSKTSSVIQIGNNEEDAMEMMCGETNSLKMVVRDRFRNRKGEGEQLKCTMIWPSATSSESHEEKCHVEYVETGAYVCTYGSKKAGNYILNLLLDGEHIVGSPLYGNIEANEAEASMCEMITMNNEESNEQMDVFVNTDQQLKMYVNTTTSWTLLEKDRDGNRRETCSLSFNCSVNVLEWEIDPFKKREQDIANDKLRFQRNLESIQDRQNKKKARKREIQEAKDLIQAKRNAHFEKHVDREMDRQNLSVAKSVVEAITTAVEEGTQAYKDTTAPDSWLFKLYDASYKHKPPAVKYYPKLKPTHNFGIEIPEYISDDEDETGNVSKTGEYQVPEHLKTEITTSCNGIIKPAGNGVFHVKIPLESHMNGKGEVSIVDSSSNTHIKGSPFKVQILSSQINDENLTSLLKCISVEQLPAFDRFTGIPIIVKIKNTAKQKQRNFSNRNIRRMMSASILPLPNVSKPDEDGKDKVPGLDLKKLNLSSFPPPDSSGILSRPSSLELEYDDSDDNDAQIKYFTARNGKFEISVKLENIHIKGSPFSFTVLGSKAHARRCLISGEGSRKAEVTKKASFTFYVCDEFGNRRIRGGDKVTGMLQPFSESLLHSQVNSEEKGTVAIEIKDNNDGTYSCSYEPKVAGWNRLLLQCNESDVFVSNETNINKVYVKPGSIDSKKCRVRIVTADTQVANDQPLSAIQLLDDSALASQAGSAMRVVIASRDKFGNDRRGKEFLDDANLFQIRVRRVDNLQMQEPTIQLVPMYDKNGMDTGQYHGVLILESVGKYVVDVTVAEYTTTRLGRWGIVRPVTTDSISIIVKPGVCYPAASTLMRLTETGTTEIMYNKELDTSEAYASVARKDVLKAGISGQTQNLNKKFWFGPFAKARSAVDISYHGIYMRSRQQLQDQIIHNLVLNGISTPKPMFLLVVGGLGAGKLHTLRSLNRYGRFPLDAFVWIDTQQIIQQIPETNVLLQDVTKKMLVVKKTAKEAGFIAEVAVQEAMSCKKCIAFSTSLGSSEWIKEWVTGLRDKYDSYAFVTIHVTAPKEDIVSRALEVKRSKGIHISDEDVLLSVERSNEEFNNLCTMNTWEYYAVINNANSKLAEDGYTVMNMPELSQEGGTQAFSVQVAPSTIGEDDMEAAEYEQRATLEQLAGKRNIRAPLDSPKHVVAMEDLDDARTWKTFCGQFDTIFDSVKFVQDSSAAARLKVQVARNIHMPRLMITAGETSCFAIITRDAYDNLRIVGEENISISLQGKNVNDNIIFDKTENESSDKQVTSSVKPLPGEGRYICSYSSDRSGEYVLNILCNEQHICGSPYNIKVLPSRVDYENCIAYGPAFNYTLLTKEVTNFTIIAHDQYGNRIRRGGDMFSVICDYGNDDKTDAINGEVLDRGDGRHDVKLKIPTDCSGKMFISVQNSTNTLSIKKSPFPVRAKRISKLELQSSYFDTVKCSTTPPEAGTLLSIPVYIPVSELTDKISLSIVPFSTVHEEQKMFSNDDVTYIVEEKTKYNYIIMFRVMRFDPTVKLQVRVACYGSQIKAADGIGLLPTLSATTTDPKYCMPLQNLGPSLSGLKYAFAGGQVNAFRIQVHDRFGNKKSTGGDQFRVTVISPIKETLSIFYVANGVYECKYTLPFLLGSLSHSNRSYPRHVKIAIEFLDNVAMEEIHSSQRDVAFDADDDNGEVWSQIRGSPFEVPVSLPLAYTLNVVDLTEKKPVQNARFRIWKGRGGEGKHILAGRVGIDGGILIGDARQWKTGLYSVEIESANFFTSRFSMFVPPPTKTSLKSLDDELTLLASRMPKDDKDDDAVVMQAPEFVYNSNKTEIPTLRVLKQGDIDLDDEGLKAQHVWWFAKKGNEIAALMNEDGTLTELTLEMCEEAFGKNPKQGTRLPTNYGQYIRLRNEYDKAYEEIETAMQSINLEESENRPNTSIDFAKTFMKPLSLPVLKKDQNYVTTFVLQWSRKSKFQPTWKIEQGDITQSNNSQKDGAFARSRLVESAESRGTCVDTLSFNSATASIKALSVISINGEEDDVDSNEFRTSLATVQVYQQGQLATILCIANAKWVNNSGTRWKIVQFNPEGEAAIVDTVFGDMKKEDVNKVEEEVEERDDQLNGNFENEDYVENPTVATAISGENNNTGKQEIIEEEALDVSDEDEDYGDDDYEDEEYEDDDWD